MVEQVGEPRGELRQTAASSVLGRSGQPSQVAPRPLTFWGQCRFAGKLIVRRKSDLTKKLAKFVAAEKFDMATDQAAEPDAQKTALYQADKFTSLIWSSACIRVFCRAGRVVPCFLLPARNAAPWSRRYPIRVPQSSVGRQA